MALLDPAGRRRAGQGQLWKVFWCLGAFLLSGRWTFCPPSLSCRGPAVGRGMRHSCFSRGSCWKALTSDCVLLALALQTSSSVQDNR